MKYYFNLSVSPKFLLNNNQKNVKRVYMYVKIELKKKIIQNDKPNLRKRKKKVCRARK